MEVVFTQKQVMLVQLVYIPVNEYLNPLYA